MNKKKILILISIFLFSSSCLASPKNKVFRNIRILNILQSHIINAYCANFVRIVSNSAKIFRDLELNTITKNNATVSWPSTVGPAGTFLASDGQGNLIYTTPPGGGNVSTTLNFNSNNAILTTDTPSGPTFLKQSGVLIDAADNITGVNNLTANTVTASLNGNATSATNFTGLLAGDVTGPQNNTSVEKIGTQTAAYIEAGATAANTATDANTANKIVKRDASGDFNAGTITANLSGNATSATNATTAISATTAANFTGSLTGDVTGTQGATVVSFVGGQNAASVASGVIAANSATNANTANAIVKRDLLGNFIASSINADLIGNVTGDLTGNADTATIAGSATNFSGSLAGDVTGGQNTTEVETVGGQTAANIASATVLANAATSSNSAGAIVRRDGSGNFSAGTITADLDGNATTATNATNANTAINFSGSLVGDVVGTQGATVVTKVGTKPADEVAAATAEVQAATSSDSADTIAKRDGSGNFATNMITVNGIISANKHVTTKEYVDNAVAAGLVAKEPARVVSTSNITPLSGLPTIDGVNNLSASDRVLLVGQTTASENGLWVIGPDPTNIWDRPTDFDTGDQAEGAYILITEGDTQAGSSWLCITPTAIIDTNPIEFVQFSLAGATTGANVGSGTGQVFRDKTGVTLNFRTIGGGTHLSVGTDTPPNEITIETDAASANTPNTIVARDNMGAFSTTLINTYSLYVDETLKLNNQSEIRFEDEIGGEYVGLRAPKTIGSSYTVDLPANQPLIGQYLQAISQSTTQWTTVDAPPASTKTFYVTKAGDDSNDGSFSAPFLTVKKAVEEANSIASFTNPVTIDIGPGIYTENNSGGPLTISTNGISIKGSTQKSTIIMPLDHSNYLFSITVANTELTNLTLNGNPGTTIAIGAISFVSDNLGSALFKELEIYSFETGLTASSATGQPVIVFKNNTVANNETSISYTNIRSLIQGSLFRGTLSNIPGNNGISLTGTNSEIAILDCFFTAFETAINVTGGAYLRLLSSNIETTLNGIVCDGTAKANIADLSVTLNVTNSINIAVSGAGTKAYIEGCLFDCEDASDTSQGTAIKVTDEAEVFVFSSSIEEAIVGIQCGETGDTNTTKVIASGVNIIESANKDIIQNGTSTLQFIGGTYETNNITITDATNVVISAFDQHGHLAIGNTTDIDQTVYQMENGQAIPPSVMYRNNYYGHKGTVYENQNNTPTCNGIQSEDDDASYYIVSGDNTKKASLNLISDTADFGSDNNIRGWEISKNGAQADLSFIYTNNDAGLPAIGPNTIMQLNGLDNQVEFPITTNPTNAVAKLIWAGDTNLYRSAANILKTNGDIIVDGLTASRVVVTDASKKLASSATTEAELGYLAGVTSPIQAQIDGKVAKAGDTMTGILTVPAGTAGNPSIQFSGSTNTGISAAMVDSLSFDTNGNERINISPTGIVTINGFTTAGIVHNNAIGALSTSLITNADISPTAAIEDTKLATISTGGKVANSATTATNANTPNAIVSRDASGNFIAGTITANLAGNVTGNLIGNADTATTAVNATSFTGPLIGDVTGTQGATVVSTVGGQTAANVAAGTILANNSTSANTAGEIVRRDGSGNFSAGTITASLTGNVTGDLTGNADTATNATNAVTATNFSGSLTGDVTGTQGTTVVSTVGGQTAANVASATVAANAATPNNTASTIVERDGSGNFSTNMITINGTVLNPTDVTTKAYVDSAVAGGLVAKDPARVVSTSNITPLSGLPTIDGESLVASDRVLLLGQTTASENGLWKIGPDPTNIWDRPTDFDTGDQAEGAYVLITEGNTQAGSSWLCTTPTAIIDTDPIEFTQFSIPGSTDAANVGAGTGQVFRDKTGNTLNFKTLAGDTHLTVTNNADDIALTTDATSANTPNTIASRDGTGTIAADLTGAASLNVLKTGDTMTGNLNMATQSEVRLEDAAGSDYVGLRAPATVDSSYTIDLPANPPTAGQFLQATSSSATEWALVDAPPSATKTYYVTKAGNDSNDGSFSFPFLTIKHAIAQADLVATSTSNPVAIDVGPGIYVEDNSGGPITINKNGISITGRAEKRVIISPVDNTTNLFNITDANIEMTNLTLQANSDSPSTAAAINFVSDDLDQSLFKEIEIYGFQTGLAGSSTSGFPVIIFKNNILANNGTNISFTNIRSLIQSTLFRGTLVNTPSNTGIYLTGADTEIAILDCFFTAFDTAINITGGSYTRILASNIETTLNGIVCTGGAKANVVGLNATLNVAGSINLTASGADTKVYLEGCLFDCEDVSDIPQGTAIKVTTGAKIFAFSTSVEEAILGIQCGDPGDTSSTEILASGVKLIDCTENIDQNGTSKLQFIAGTFEIDKITINDATNVVISAFDEDGYFTIGNTTDINQIIYEINNGQTTLPLVEYRNNYYGHKGTIYKNPNNNPTCNGIQADNNNANYYVVTGDNTKEASLNLISDTANIGTDDNVRGWEITKEGAQANLTFDYKNNDASGLANRGQNPVMQLNGFDNQVEFPVATNTPLPLNTVAKLVWATDTYLYRDSANTLKTDGDLIVDNLTASRIVVTDASNKLASSATTEAELGYLSGVTAPIQGQLDGKVAKAGDTMTGTLTVPAGSAANPSIQFTGSTNTGISAATVNTLSLDTNGQERIKISPTGTIAINGFTTTGIVHNNVSGELSTSQIVNADIAAGAAIEDTKLATITTGGKVANSATTATNANTPNTIVLRDGSGNFNAGTITADLTGNVTGNLNGTATYAETTGSTVNFSGFLTGDVTGTQDNTVVETVGGQTAANIAAATVLANAATSSNTPSTIVRRDGSGNFSAEAITAAKLILTGVLCEQAIQIAAATTGGSVTVNATTSILMLNSAGNVDNYTVNFPPSPTNGQKFTILTRNTGNTDINLINIGGTGGASVANAILRLNPTDRLVGTRGGTSVTYIYYAADNAWYRCGRG